MSFKKQHNTSRDKDRLLTNTMEGKEKTDYVKWQQKKDKLRERTDESMGNIRFRG